MKISLLRLIRSLAYCTKSSKTPFLLKLKNSCTFHLLGPICHTAHPCGALFNSRHYIAGKVQ